MRRHAHWSALGTFPSSGRRRLAWAAVALLAVAAVAALETASGQEATTAETAATQPTTTTTPTTAPALEPPEKKYGLWVLVPPITAILLAILLRQVIPALSVAVLVAAFMMMAVKTPERLNVVEYTIGAVRLAVEGYLIGALIDSDHAMVILFTLIIGGMVGIIEANGGTRAVVQKMARWACNARRGQLTTWFAGLLVFFDDYANCMIIGPTMRPVFDKLRISRAKLAYIVDSTAAPVASIMIGTWLATEISMIDEGLKSVREAGAPAFLTGVSAFEAFWYSIPYRFYAILALVMVVLVALLQRDFGPMRSAERRALEAAGTNAAEMPTLKAPRGRWWFAAVPVAVMVVAAIALLLATGWHEGLSAYAAAVEEGLIIETSVWSVTLAKTIQILGEANAYTSILYAAILAFVVALTITLATRALKVKDVMEGALNGMTRIFPALVVLVLAWALSYASGKDELRLGFVAQKYLAGVLAPQWLPFFVFLAAAVVSFATGTSWGTMTILCPLAVTLGAGLAATVPEPQQLDLFYATVGSVLVGAVFGDHCSPISDTTVLSSLASECSLEDHVWTQMPYALTVAGVSILCGDILCRQFDQPAWVGLLVGTGALVLIVLIVGRKPTRAAEPAPNTTN